jgi:hypothetical protein
MDKEQYVTYKVAQLLKEKGLPQSTSICNVVYKPNGKISFNAKSFINPHYFFKDCYIFAPTQQMACKWLREEHNILVTVAPCEVGAGVDDYTYVIYEIQPEDYHFEFIEQGRMQPVAYTMDYEGTLEEGIKHVLTNLI